MWETHTCPPPEQFLWCKALVLNSNKQFQFSQRLRRLCTFTDSFASRSAKWHAGTSIPSTRKRSRTFSRFHGSLDFKKFNPDLPSTAPHNLPLFVLYNCPPEQALNCFHCFSVPTVCLQHLVNFHLPIPQTFLFVYSFGLPTFRLKGKIQDTRSSSPADCKQMSRAAS